MNKDVLAGRWKQLRGQVRERWGKLTDNELDKISGKRDQLIGRAQKKYGYIKTKTKRQFDGLRKKMESIEKRRRKTK